MTVTLLGLNSQQATVPVAGASVSLSQGTGHSVITSSPATSNASGVATFTVTDSTPEKVTYTATGGSVTVSQTAQVTFGAQAVSATKSTITASPPSVPADGSSAAVVTVTVLDQAVGPQPIQGVAVTLTKSAGASAVITTVSGTSNSSGVATFSVTDSSIEPVTFTGRLVASR